MLPARCGRVVVGGIHHVPSEHHVAKPKTASRVGFGSAQELVTVQVLAAQDAVDVADCNFYLLGFTSAHMLDRGMFGKGIFLRSNHC